MEFSTDQRHAETLDFLREVRDYLAAWPPHPANRAFLARIDEHLAEPMHRIRGLLVFSAISDGTQS